MLFWPCHGTYLPAGCFKTRSWPSRHGDHMPPDCENPHLPTWSSSFLIPRWNSSNKSGISWDFTPIIKDHQSIFQAPSSRIYPPEDRSRMAVLVRSAAEAFQSEDADPGALRCATAQRHAAVMPQCQSLQKIWVIDNFTMWNPQAHDTHAHFWHEHPFSKGIWWWTADPWSNSNGGLHSHPGLFVQLVHGPLWVQKIHESLRNMPPEASVGVRLTDLFSKFGGFIRPYDVLYVFWGLKVNALAPRFWRETCHFIIAIMNPERLAWRSLKMPRPWICSRFFNGHRCHSFHLGGSCRSPMVVLVVHQVVHQVQGQRSSVGRRIPSFRDTAAAEPAVTPSAWPQSDPASAPVANAGWPGAAGEPPAAPQWPSAPSNPFRKEVKEEKSEAAEMQVTPQDMILGSAEGFFSKLSHLSIHCVGNLGMYIFLGPANARMAGAKFAQDSGVSAKDMMTGARYAQQSGITPQHALDGARMAHQAGVRPQHVVQGAQMAHQAGLRPQHFVQGAKADTWHKHLGDLVRYTDMALKAPLK